MLVLSRRLGEKVVVMVGSKEIVLTVVDIDRGKIRIGLDAPAEFAIFREELLPPRNDAPFDGQ